SWSQQTKLAAPNGATGGQFGYSVAISGDVNGERVVIGAVNQNAAHIFTRSNGVWSWNQTLIANDGLGSFGNSVAISGSIVVVGDPDHDEGSRTDQGAAYVFVLNLSNRTSTQQKLTAGGSYSNFGYSVAINSGSRLVVGAPCDDLCDDRFGIIETC